MQSALLINFLLFNFENFSEFFQKLFKCVLKVKYSLKYLMKKFSEVGISISLWGDKKYYNESKIVKKKNKHFRSLENLWNF